jgi:hypothetical protein
MRRSVAVPCLALALASCGSSSINPAGGADGGSQSDAPVTPPTDAPFSTQDGPTADTGNADTGLDTGGGGAGDGTPSYTGACTPSFQQNGTAVSSYHGRLDGYLSYVVPEGGPGSCNGDNSHVHLQVRVSGSVYDVAVDVGKFSGDVLFYESDLPLPDGAWSEGWHGNANLDYVQLGLHSGQFTPEDPAALGQKIQSELAGVNHISVFGIGYMQGNGCHDIHYYNGSGNDGAIVVHPLASPAHALFFHFSTQSF